MSVLADARFQSAAVAFLEHAVSAQGKPLPHDPNDKNHVAYLEAVAELNGYNAQRYPALFASFRKRPTLSAGFGGTGNTGAFNDNQTVDYVAPLASNGLASSHALITRTKPVASTFVALSVMNINGNVKTVVASGAATSFLQQTTEVQTRDASAGQLPSTGQNYASISWSVQYQDGTSEANTDSSQWAYQTSQDPTVTAPAINPNRHTGNLNNIMVGLSRGFNSPSNNSDIDYWFWQNQSQNITLLVPMVGSMYFTKPIAPLSSANPQLFFYLARTEGGMSELSAGNTAPYMSGFTIDPSNPNKLNFSLQATATAAGNAINFGSSPWVADTQTFFTGKVVVTLNDNSLGWSSILSSLQPDTNPTDGVTYIKPIMYVWHCLAAGTQISMADGSTQAVENLNVGAQVKSAGGTTQNVMATLAQPHWGTVYVINTAAGSTLTCSGTHPMMTPGGAVQASTLASGNTLLTQNGSTTVSQISQAQQTGAGLFNLWLDGPAGNTTFYANGLLVGDYQMQVALVRAPSPAAVKAKLPAHLHADYESHLADIAKRVTR
jgi:hypothetical protein